MKKLVFTIMLTLGFLALTQAQVMNCNGSSSGAKVTFVEQDLTTVTLLVDWDEGSTFSSSSLALTNATCSSCPFIGGIGRPNGIQKTYVLNKIDNTQPVVVDWGPIGTSAYCGAQSITVQPSPAPSSGQDNALNFLQGDYVLVNNPNDFQVGATTDFTIEAVIKTTYNSAVNRCIFSKMVDNFNPNQVITGYQFWLTNGRVTLEWANNNIAAQNISGTSMIADNQCHHIAVVVDRSASNAKLYVDGVLEADVTHPRYAVNIDNIAPVYIGRERQAIGGNFWYGSLDEVAFFKSARTATEISRSATFALSGTEAGLTGYWKFDSGVDGADNTGLTNAIDETGGNNGTLIGFDLTGTEVVTNAPDGVPGSPPVIVGNWETSPCPLSVATCSGQDNILNFRQGDYVLVNNPSDFQVGANTNFTIEAVIRSTYNAGNQTRCIFSKMVDNFNPNQVITGYQFWVTNGRLTLEWANNGQAAQNISGTSIVSDGQCHHVAMVVDRSASNAKLYVDGVLEADVTHPRYAVDIDNIAPVYIGRERQAIGGAFWYGDLDEVAFFKSARTATEISRSATFALSGTEAGLTGYWKFDSGVDGADNTGEITAIDETGGNNGTLIGFDLTGTEVLTNTPHGNPFVTGTWKDNSCPLMSVCDPQPDNALDFEQGDYVLVDNPEDFQVGANTDFTIEALIRTTYNGVATRCIFSKMVDNFNPNQAITGYQFWLTNGRVTLEWANNGIAAQNISGTSMIADNQCHHVAVVVDRSASNAKLYVDGVLEANVTHPRYAIDIDNIAPVYIGRERQAIGGNFWYGSLDDVAFFNTTRTGAEIQQSATASLTGASLTGTESGLIGYWKFDSGVPGADNTGVTTAIDETGLNNGTLIGFDLTGTKVVTNAPNGVPGSTPMVVSNWVANPCSAPNPLSPPVIDPLTDITLPGCDGTVVFYDYSSAVTSSTPVTITYNPATPSAFNLGSTQVTMTATNVDGSATATFNVIIEDNVAPTLALLGDNPLMLCQGESFVDPLGIPDDNCGLSDFQPSGTVDVNTPGTYTVTYTVTDVAGNTVSAGRTVIVKPNPAALAQDNCPNNNPTCGRIDLRICPYGNQPDLPATAMANPAYVSGASLNWYGYNGANNPPGAQLPIPPTVDMETPLQNTNAWITQTVDGCESAPTRIRVRTLRDRDPGLTLDLSNITLPTCGGASIDFLPAVSGFANNVSGFRFYTGKPNQGGTLLTSTSGATVANVGDPHFYAPVSNGTNDYYVQSIMSNANQCGGEASDQASLSGGANPEITALEVTINGVLTTYTDFSSPIVLPISCGDLFNVNYISSNATSVISYYDDANSTGFYAFSFGSSYSGTFGNPGTARAIPYNGSCTGQPIDYIWPSTNCRSAQGGTDGLNSILLSASSLDRNEVALKWDIDLARTTGLGALTKMDFETIVIQKEVAVNQFETIHSLTYKGEGYYRYNDFNSNDDGSRYRIMLLTADGSGIFSNEAEVKSDGFIDPNAFSIFPNPTTDRVQIQALFPMEEAYTWQLTDMIGKTIMTGSMQEAEMSLDVSRLPNGVYQFMTISREGARTVNRIVKQ